MAMTCKYRVTRELRDYRGGKPLLHTGLYCTLLEGRIRPNMCENCRHNPAGPVPRSQVRLFPIKLGGSS